MTKKLFIVTILITLALSACSGAGTAEPATPAATETQIPATVPPTTQAPAGTETFTVTPETPGTQASATPTVGTVAPTNPPDCTNIASFVADITIPDKTNVAGGTSFTKTWRIANSGTCVWGPDYKLTHYSEERMAAPDEVPLAITYPGQNVDISVDLTAPNSTGLHQANFVIANSAGAIMKIADDSRLWVIIDVTVGGTATPTVAATSTAAQATLVSPTAATGGVVVATPLSTLPAATTSGSGTSSASCLFSIDRTKLMEVITAVNAYRAEKNLAAFNINTKLAQAAQRHANDMACNKLSVHMGSDGSTPQSRVAATGYVASLVSENIYGSNPPFTGQGVVNWWITDTKDARNNENLLNTTFTDIGVGYSFFDNSGYYVLVFAKP